ncbi:MAG: hypothetical protein AAF787_22620, partial [Chloroflexota bacterium]
MTDLYFELAGQQLQELNGNTGLVFIHPHYLNQRYLLETLIEQHGTVYVRFDVTGSDLEQVNEQFRVALASQTDTGTIEAVSNLVLDECDRLDDETLEQFLQAVSGDVIGASGGRIVIIGRRVPGFVTAATDAKQNGKFLPVDESLLLVDYIRDEEKPALLEVHAFGSGRVYLNGREVDNWDGVLPRSLFFYIVDRGMTTRDDIFKIFWPNLTTKEA